MSSETPERVRAGNTLFELDGGADLAGLSAKQRTHRHEAMHITPDRYIHDAGEKERPEDVPRGVRELHLLFS